MSLDYDLEVRLLLRFAAIAALAVLAITILIQVKSCTDVYEDCLRRTEAIDPAACRELRPW